MLYLDIETIGFLGPPILIQTAKRDLDIQLYYVWEHSIQETLDLFASFCEEQIIGFNLSFDWFHINKWYNIFSAMPNKDEKPVPLKVRAMELALKETKWCLKPRGVLDLFLYACQGPLQSLMLERDAKDAVITIPKVPKVVVEHLIPLLPYEEIPPIYFFHHKNPGWQISEVSDELVDVSLRLAPTLKLKEIIRHLQYLGELPKNKEVIDYPLPSRICPPKSPEWSPTSCEWLPYWEASTHYWSTNQKAIQYASDDIHWLRVLYEYWDHPEFNDLNSQLAIQTACDRWFGIELDQDKVTSEINKFEVIAESAPKARRQALKYINHDDNPLIKIQLPDTSKETLTGFIERNDNEYGQRAKRVQEARRATKRLEILYKLRESHRFHPSFSVVGTKSNRMAGRGGFNPQGIARDKDIRAIFQFSSGGDYESFEVTIADAEYNDDKLHQDLLDGRSIHGILGAKLYEITYNEVVESKGTADNKYNPAKNTIFAYFYGAEAYRVSITANIDEEHARNVMDEFNEMYPQIAKERAKVKDQFCSVTQPGGIGTPLIWKDPAEYVETKLGDRRYYTFENLIIKKLFHLLETLPMAWNQLGPEVIRSKSRGPQGVANATRSAISGTVFKLQQRNMRTAANHKIQAFGAKICKSLHCALWELQPVGVHPHKIAIYNFHDELMTSHDDDLISEMQKIIDQHLKDFRKQVPLLNINWKFGIKNWSER